MRAHRPAARPRTRRAWAGIPTRRPPPWPGNSGRMGAGAASTAAISSVVVAWRSFAATHAGLATALRNPTFARAGRHAPPQHRTRPQIVGVPPVRPLRTWRGRRGSTGTKCRWPAAPTPPGQTVPLGHALAGAVGSDGRRLQVCPHCCMEPEGGTETQQSGGSSSLGGRQKASNRVFVPPIGPFGCPSGASWTGDRPMQQCPLRSAYRGVTRLGTPLVGRSVMWLVYRGSPGGAENSKSRTSTARAITDSSIEKCCPMHPRGPPPNGYHA
jgi:hypothetical protein